MRVAAETFRKYAKVSPEEVIDKERVEDKVWRVLPPIHAVCYVIDARCILGDSAFEIETSE